MHRREEISADAIDQLRRGLQQDHMEARRGVIFAGPLLSQSHYVFSKWLPSLWHPTLVEMGRQQCVHYCASTRCHRLDPSLLRRKALHPQHCPDQHLRDDMPHSDLPIYRNYATINSIIYGLGIGRVLSWHWARSRLRILQLAQIRSRNHGSCDWSHPRRLGLHSLLQQTS